MREIAKLKRDWDRRGSTEVSSDALAFAWSILNQIMPPKASPPSIVPLGNGGVQLLWHNQKSDLEVEIVRPNEVVLYHLDKGSGQEEEKPLTTDFSSITGILWSRFNAP
jgi:hypothetical protein